MKYNQVMILILLLIFLFGYCGSEDPSQIRKKKDVVAIIYCDLSTSVDSTSIYKVADDAQKLLNYFPRGSILHFYPIDQSPFVSPILEFTKPLLGGTSSEEAENEMFINMAASTIYNQIIQKYRKINSNPKDRNVARSCILRTLETAHLLFRQYRIIPNKNYKYELIYLSDMLEECYDSPIGPLFMTKRYHQLAKEKLESYNPNFDLSYAKISIINSVDFEKGPSPYIKYEDLKNLWKKIFLKVGFTEEQIIDFNFSPRIPHRFTEYEKYNL